MRRHIIRWLTALCLALGLTGFAACGSLAPNEGPMTPVDLETAKQQALEVARVHPKVDFPPERASWSGLQHPYFEEYYFVYVWGPLGHSQNSPFAVSQQGSVFKLPEEFNQLTRDRGLNLLALEHAQSLLEFYLEFEILWPGYDSHIVLSDIMDIPDIEEQEEIIEQFGSVVKPMEISSHQEGWAFDFFTWRYVNGVLFQWEVRVNRVGEVDVERRETLATRVGDYILIQ